MRQETGKTNLPQSGYKVSIQQSLDGHSFSVPALPGTDDGMLEVEVLTTRTQLVPAAYFSVEHAAELLAAAGLAPESDETVVWSDPQSEVVAVMALPRAQRERIESQFRQVKYTTPLLEHSASAARSVWLYRTGGLLYIKVMTDERQLALAEVIPAPEEPDIRYFLERLAMAFPLQEYTLQAAGENPKQFCKQFGRLFKKTSCA